MLVCVDLWPYSRGDRVGRIHGLAVALFLAMVSCPGVFCHSIQSPPYCDDGRVAIFGDLVNLDRKRSNAHLPSHRGRE